MKAFLSEECKPTEENNRMGKIRELFKKTGDTKGTFQARMDTIKDRKGKDLKKQKRLRNEARINRRTVQETSQGPG